MTRRTSIVLLLGAWLAAAGAGGARAAEFQLRTLAGEVQLGDPFDVVLESKDAQFDGGRIEKVEFRIEGDRWHQATPWAPLDRERKIAPGQSSQWAWRAKLQGLEAGEWSLPETHVYLKADGPATRSDVLATTATIRIIGVRDPAETDTKLAGLKPLRPVPHGWGWVWAAAAGAAVAGLLAWLLIRRLRKAKAPVPVGPPEPELPPGPWAMREFDLRRALHECRPGQAKAIDSHASEVVRVYLARRFAIPAMDLTTFECLRVLEARGVEPGLISRVKKLLDECDMVKFSKFEPPPARWEEIWEDAREIVRASTAPLEFSEGERILGEWAAMRDAAARKARPA